MSILRICTREPVYIDQQAGIVEVAQLLRQHHVGSVIVVDGQGRPVGIVTDRDIVIEVIAEEVPIDSVCVRDIMSPQLLTVREDAGIEEVLDRLREAGVRRAPVVDGEGLLSGIVSLDDILRHLSEEIYTLSRVIDREQDLEAARRSG